MIWTAYMNETDEYMFEVYIIYRRVPVHSLAQTIRNMLFRGCRTYTCYSSLLDTVSGTLNRNKFTFKWGGKTQRVKNDFSLIVIKLAKQIGLI